MVNSVWCRERSYGSERCVEKPADERLSRREQWFAEQSHTGAEYFCVSKHIDGVEIVLRAGVVGEVRFLRC
jgi:hypothetical protein